jgi:hypothetical protein
MRTAGLAAALLLSCCVAGPPAEPDAKPTSVELTFWCARFPDAACRRRADDAARARCGAVGSKASFVRSALLQRSFTQGQKGYFLYDCVR